MWLGVCDKHCTVPEQVNHPMSDHGACREVVCLFVFVNLQIIDCCFVVALSNGLQLSALKEFSFVKITKTQNDK